MIKYVKKIEKASQARLCSRLICNATGACVVQVLPNSFVPNRRWTSHVPQLLTLNRTESRACGSQEKPLARSSSHFRACLIFLPAVHLLLRAQRQIIHSSGGCQGGIFPLIVMSSIMEWYAHAATTVAIAPPTASREL